VPAAISITKDVVAILDEGNGVACRILVRRHVDLPDLLATLRSSPPPAT
jgi:hypothetical protein